MPFDSEEYWNYLATIVRRKVYITRFAVTEGIYQAVCQIVKCEGGEYAIREWTDYNGQEVLHHKSQYNPGEWFDNEDDALAKANEMFEHKIECLRKHQARLMKKREIKLLDENCDCIGTLNLREYQENHPEDEPEPEATPTPVPEPMTGRDFRMMQEDRIKRYFRHH